MRREHWDKRSPGSWLSPVSAHLGTMVCLPGFSWVFLSALLHSVTPWGAERPDRPRQCDAPKSVSRVGTHQTKHTIRPDIILHTYGGTKRHLLRCTSELREDKVALVKVFQSFPVPPLQLAQRARLIISLTSTYSIHVLSLWGQSHPLNLS